MDASDAVRWVFQRFLPVGGLVALWGFLWPLIYVSLEALALENGTVLGMFPYKDLNNEFWRVAILLFLTLWFFLYVNGFCREWELTALKLHLVPIIAIRWTFYMLWFLVFPFIFSQLMYLLLDLFTEVPEWLKIATGHGVYFLVQFLKGFYYPEIKIAQIEASLRFQ